MSENSNSRKSDFNQEFLSKSKLKRLLFYIAGSVCLALGIIGIVIPILPTTPFLLLAAACYIRSSEKAYNWIINNKIFGKYIKDFREGKGLPIKIRIYTISLLWITMIISIIIVQILWIRILLIIIAVIVSIHVALIRAKNHE
ncbi:MAG: YbaN family protein [Candidatus Lokiarchaeota archaeon]|nr:YbaN family protein [Candidatus Lokiarchaeota archaeon]